MEVDRGASFCRLFFFKVNDFREAFLFLLIDIHIKRLNRKQEVLIQKFPEGKQNV